MDVIERIEKGELEVQVTINRHGYDEFHEFATADLMKLAKLGKQTQWVSVEERLPAKDDTVLVWAGTTCVRACVGKTPYGPAWYLVDRECFLNWWSVTHWMPLPLAPKGAE